MANNEENKAARDPLNQAFFQQKSDKAAERHFDRIIEKAREIEDKVRNVPALHEFWKDVLLCLELIRDYRSGIYTDIEAWAVVAVVFGLLYPINPVELIPDFIPVVGYLDDVAVLMLVLKPVKVELEKYKAWRNTSS